MRRQQILFITTIILSMLVIFFVIRTTRLNKENSELKDIIRKSILPIDLANWKKYNDIKRIKAFEYKIKDTLIDREKYLGLNQIDSLYKLFGSSSEADTADIVSLVRQKIILNDSLLSFLGNYSICDDGYINLMINSFLSHDSVYRYGDTVSFVVLVNQHLIGNNYEIIDYSNKDIGSIENNIITYKIPTQKLSGNIDLPKEVKFSYHIITRNAYTNKVDTFYSWTKFTIVK